MKAKYYIAILSALVLSCMPLEAQIGNGIETNVSRQIRFVREPDRSQEMNTLPASRHQIQPLDIKRSASDITRIPEGLDQTRSSCFQCSSSDINSPPDRSNKGALTPLRPSEMRSAPAGNARNTLKHQKKYYICLFSK